MTYQTYEQEREEALFSESQPHNPVLMAEQEARQFGYKRPEQEWLSTSYDTWVKNPYFSGISGPHPEEL